VSEPTIEETYQILRGLKTRFEEHHDVKYADKALRAAVELSDRYINDRHLPDKAIDVIDEAGASQRLLPVSKRKKVINVTEIETIMAKIARIPPKSVSSSTTRSAAQSGARPETGGVRSGRSHYGVGQRDQAVARRLGPEQKPIGCFLFAGPTGRGQNRSHQAAGQDHGHRADPLRHVRIHGAAYGVAPDRRAARLCRFDQGGLLTDAILKHPHCVLLLDEIEKAHPDVFNLLLQVMDHGTLTDNNGRKADFRNVILVMTTNAGAEQMDRPSSASPCRITARDGMEAIKRMFSPEFRNRLDAIVQFKALTPVTIAQVVDKFLIELEAQLESKKVTLEVDGRGGSGWPSAVTIPRWAHGRWRGSFRRASSVAGRGIAVWAADERRSCAGQCARRRSASGNCRGRGSALSGNKAGVVGDMRRKSRWLPCWGR
jgi:ATP-dependent Clp protease ATP-binding subunit ClpA